MCLGGLHRRSQFRLGDLMGKDPGDAEPQADPLGARDVLAEQRTGQRARHQRLGAVDQGGRAAVGDVRLRDGRALDDAGPRHVHDAVRSL